MSDKQNHRREKGGLIESAEVTGCHDLLIITADSEDIVFAARRNCVSAAAEKKQETSHCRDCLLLVMAVKVNKWG